MFPARDFSKSTRFASRVLDVFNAAGLPSGLHFRPRAKDDSTPAELWLYDEIGPFGITAKDMIAALQDAGPGPIKVRVNSPGGDVFDGLAMYAALQAHDGPVEAVVDGVAASAASFLAMAGQKTSMAPNALMMVHNAWGVVVGNKNDMRGTANTLDKIDGQLASMYAKKSGKSVKTTSAMMDAETWLTADEAVDTGFADEIIDLPNAEAHAARFKAEEDAKAAEAKAAEIAEAERIAEQEAAEIAAAEQTKFQNEIKRRLMRLRTVV